MAHRQSFADYGVALSKVHLEQRFEWLKRPMRDLHVLLHFWHLKIDSSMFGVVVVVMSRWLSLRLARLSSAARTMASSVLRLVVSCCFQAVLLLILHYYCNNSVVMEYAKFQLDNSDIKINLALLIMLHTVTGSYIQLYKNICNIK